MHGADWPAVKRKYAAFLPELATRNDLYRVMRWMLSELAVELAYGVGVLRQRLPHPERGQLGVVMFGGDGGAFKGGPAAFGAVVTHQNFLKHGQHDFLTFLSAPPGAGFCG